MHLTPNHPPPADPFSTLSTLLYAPDIESLQSIPEGSWTPTSYWLSLTRGTAIGQWGGGGEARGQTVYCLVLFLPRLRWWLCSLSPRSGGQPLFYSLSSHQFRGPLSPCPFRSGSSKGFLLRLVPRCCNPVPLLHSPFIKLFSVKPCDCSRLFLLVCLGQGANGLLDRTIWQWPAGWIAGMGSVWRESVDEG